MKKIGSLIFWLLLWTSQAFAGVVTGELDKLEGTLEDQFVYTLVIQGSLDGEPQFPAIDGLTIERSGTSQSVSIVNGHFSRELQYQYTVVPQRAGVFTIPPVRAKVDGAMQETLPLELKIQAPAQGSAERSDQALFVERSFSRDKVYVGESIIARVLIYNKVKLYSATPEINYPPSFQAQAIEDQKNYTKVIAGEEYTVTELNTVLTPKQEGSFDINPAILHAKIAGARRRSRSLLDDWHNSGNVVQKRFRSPPGHIEVLPLPIDGRRIDYSGLVGEFSATAEVSKRELKVGETTTVTVQVSGWGATAGMADPELKLGDRAKIYRDKPQSNDEVNPERGLKGLRTIKYAVVPTVAGELNLGQLHIQYFNSMVGQYQDMQLDLGQVTVQANGAETPPSPANSGTNSMAASEPPKAVAKLGDDLVEPHGPNRWTSHDQMSAIDLTAGGLVSFASLLLFSGTLWRQNRQSTESERLAKRKASLALKQLQRQLTEAESHLARQDARGAIQLAQGSLKNYLGDKFMVHTSSLTQKDVESFLKAKNFDDGIVRKVRELWLAMDQMLYGQSSMNPAATQALLHDMNQTMQEVDKRC